MYPRAHSASLNMFRPPKETNIERFCASTASIKRARTGRAVDDGGARNSKQEGRKSKHIAVNTRSRLFSSLSYYAQTSPRPKHAYDVHYAPPPDRPILGASGYATTRCGCSVEVRPRYASVAKTRAGAHHDPSTVAGHSSCLRFLLCRVFLSITSVFVCRAFSLQLGVIALLCRDRGA